MTVRGIRSGPGAGPVDAPAEVCYSTFSGPLDPRLRRP